MQLKVFGLNESKDYAKKVAKHLDISLASHVERRFEDGEVYVRSDENVRGCDVYVISSLFTGPTLSAGEKLTTLQFFIGSLRDASAARITAVIPYFGYARQDRKTESRAPISTKYLAMMLESVGLDRVLTMDHHNLAALQNSFRIPTDNLEGKNLLAKRLINEGLPSNIAIMSPDSGGMSRTRLFRASVAKMLGIDNIDLVYLDKQHNNSGLITGDRIVGDVSGKQVVVLDDMISSGSTIKVCKDAIEAHGGELYCVCASHGLFVGQANEYMAGIKQLHITDSVPPFRLKDQTNVNVISTTKFFARAINRTHVDGGSISELLQ